MLLVTIGFRYNKDVIPSSFICDHLGQRVFTFTKQQQPMG
jgi:hypothetical protein